MLAFTSPLHEKHKYFHCNALSSMKLCILQPALNAVSETFIRAHAERLPARVTVAHGLNSGRVCVGEKPVLSQTLPSRALRKLGRMLTRRPWSWETTAALLAVFRRYRPQAVLAEYGTTGVRAMEACRLRRIPLIVHFHGFDASKKSYLEEYREAYCRLFQEAAAIVAVSQAMRRKLISLGAAPEKVRYCPYGVDCEQFGGATPSDRLPVFLAVGRFVEKKAPNLTLLAFAEVYRSRPEARLRMIGEGPLLGPCRNIAESLRLNDAVTFLGAQPHQMVEHEMRSARAFVQHSLEASDGDCEGTPVAILEAGASGLPAVATWHAGIPDVVIDEETGLLVDERDVAGMAMRMRRLLDEPDLATRLGRAARTRIERHFSMEESIGRLWNIIEAAVQGAPLPVCNNLDSTEPTTT